MEIKKCGIYKITSPSGKIYIGQSVNIKDRIKAYKCGHCKEQPFVCNSILKHGWENHKFEIIEECQEENLNYLEKYYVDFYDSKN